MNGENPLQDLKDIHLPEQISAWPPAPGWWILAFLILALVSWITWKLWKSYQQRQLLRVSLASLKSIEQVYQVEQNDQLLLKQYSTLLRRVALARFSRQQTASLTGSDWINFLNSSSDRELFCSEAASLLLNAPYQKPAARLEHLDKVAEATKSWIRIVTRSSKNSSAKLKTAVTNS